MTGSPQFNVFYSGIANKQDRYGLTKGELGSELRQWLDDLPEGGKVEIVRVRRVLL